MRNSRASSSGPLRPQRHRTFRGLQSSSASLTGAVPFVPGKRAGKSPLPGEADQFAKLTPKRDQAFDHDVDRRGFEIQMDAQRLGATRPAAAVAGWSRTAWRIVGQRPHRLRVGLDRHHVRARTGGRLYQADEAVRDQTLKLRSMNSQARKRRLPLSAEMRSMMHAPSRHPRDALCRALGDDTGRQLMQWRSILVVGVGAASRRLGNSSASSADEKAGWLETGPAQRPLTDATAGDLEPPIE